MRVLKTAHAINMQSLTEKLDSVNTTEVATHYTKEKGGERKPTTLKSGLIGNPVKLPSRSTNNLHTRLKL